MNVLLNSGYDVNVGNATNFRPVWWAMKRCNVELTRMLLEARAEWDTVKRTLGYVQKGGFHPLFPHGDSLGAFLGNWPVLNTVDMLALRYDEYKQDMYTEFDGIPATRKTNTFVSLQGDPSIVERDDMSLVTWFLDRGFDPNTDFRYPPVAGYTGFTFVASVMSEAAKSKVPSYIMALLDAGGDPKGKVPIATTQAWADAAEGDAYLTTTHDFIWTMELACSMESNTVAWTAYQDWLGFQKAKAAAGM